MASACSFRSRGAGVARSSPGAPSRGRQTGKQTMKAFMNSIVAISLLTYPGTPILAQGSGTGAPVARQSVPARSASQPVDGGWPRVYATGSAASGVIYEPQIARWTHQKNTVLYPAISYQPQAKAS